MLLFLRISKWGYENKCQTIVPQLISYLNVKSLQNVNCLSEGHRLTPPLFHLVSLYIIFEQSLLVSLFDEQTAEQFLPFSQNVFINAETSNKVRIKSKVKHLQRQCPHPYEFLFLKVTAKIIIILVSGGQVKKIRTYPLFLL